MGVVLTLAGSDFDDATMFRRGADELLTGGTLHMFDFANAAGYPSQAASITGSVFDLSPTTGAAATLVNSASFNLAGGGAVTASLSGNRGMQWSNSAYNLEPLQDGGHFLICAWCKPTATDLAAGTSNLNVPVVYRVGALNAGRADTTGFLGIGVQLGNFCLFSGGVAPTTHAMSVATAAVTQIALECVYEAGAGTLAINVYKNGALESQKAGTYADWTTPTTPAAIISDAGSGANFAQFEGRIYRGFLENVGVSRIDVAEWVYRDYQANNGRFS